MTYSGSVTIKKIHLLNMIENQKHIFRSDVSDDCKWHSWGRQISYETLLENDISDYNWDKWIHRSLFFNPRTMARGFDLLFNSEFTPKGE